MKLLAALALVASAVAAPLLLGARQRLDGRHLLVVREGVLYRSAQLPTSGVGRLKRDLGIRTVVSLRDSDRPEDQAEERFCADNGLRFVRIEPLSWDGKQGSAPIDDGLRRFLEVMAEPKNHPVLVHCYRGHHRTGAYTAVYRMECEGWGRDRALTEMVAAGYDLLEQHHDLRGYLKGYVAGTKYRLGPQAGERRRGPSAELTDAAPRPAGTSGPRPLRGGVNSGQPDASAPEGAT